MERLALEVFADFAGGVVAAGAGETGAGVGAGTAEVEMANGSAVARPTEQGAHGEKLIESGFAMEDVAAGKTVIHFEILGSEHFAVEKERADLRNVFFERFDDGITERFAVRVPIAGF